MEILHVLTMRLPGSICLFQVISGAPWPDNIQMACTLFLEDNCQRFPALVTLAINKKLSYLWVKPRYFPFLHQKGIHRIWLTFNCPICLQLQYTIPQMTTWQLCLSSGKPRRCSQARKHLFGPLPNFVIKNLINSHGNETTVGLLQPSISLQGKMELWTWLLDELLNDF